MLTPLLPLLAVLTLMVLAPLAGALLGGAHFAELLRLPLTERAWDPLGASLPVTIAAWSLTAALVGATFWLARPHGAKTQRTVETRTSAPLPRYTWFGVFALIVAVAAVDGGAVNLATGLITLAVTLFANADTQRRTGNSLLRQRPGYFFSLFPASLVVGWAFYWLNLWLQVWTYPAATETVPFMLGKSADYAVLLPALLSLRQWLASIPPLLGWTTQARPLNGQPSAQEGAILLGLGAIALVSAALWPDWIYPLTLVAPLLLAIGLQQLRGQPTLFAGLAHGDWSRVLLTAVAGLLIGLLSQACNQLLGPAWTFHLPLLGGPSLFDLPLPAWLWLSALGLFGLWVGDQLTAPWKRRPQQPQFRPRFPVKVVLEDLVRKAKH